MGDPGGRRDDGAVPEDVVGDIIAVRGSKADVGLADVGLAGVGLAGAGSAGTAPAAGGAAPAARPRVTVGSFLAVEVGAACLVGMVTEVADRGDGRRTAALDLVGEIGGGGGAERFRRGVSTYPTLGDPVRPLPPGRLNLIYSAGGARSIAVGSMFHDPAMPARADRRLGSRKPWIKQAPRSRRGGGASLTGGAASSFP